MDANRVGGRIELDVLTVDSPHGVYIYDPSKDKWVLTSSNGEAFQPNRDGVYVIYFDNSLCPACRIYDLSWYTYVKLFASMHENVYFVIIYCDWFAQKCGSRAAAESFKKYNIHASPTTLLLEVEGGKIVREERFEGSKPLEKLADIIEGFISGK